MSLVGVTLLRFFENGEDIPFAVDMGEKPEDAFILSDDEGPRVFKIMPDKSFKRFTGSRVDVWLERARTISEAEAMRLASMR